MPLIEQKGDEMKNYKLAVSIYDDYKDMDFMDYDDTREESISFIASMLDEIGESDTRAMLNNLMY